MWGVTDQDLHAAIRRAGGPERRRSKTIASRTSRSVTGYQRVTSRIDPSASTALASVAVGIPLLLTIGARRIAVIEHDQALPAERPSARDLSVEVHVAKAGLNDPVEPVLVAQNVVELGFPGLATDLQEQAHASVRKLAVAKGWLCWTSCLASCNAPGAAAVG
jgi:hypothetical protein